MQRRHEVNNQVWTLEHWLTHRPAGLYAVCVNNVALQVGLYGDAKNNFLKKLSAKSRCSNRLERPKMWVTWNHVSRIVVRITEDDIINICPSRQRHVSVLRVIPTFKCTSSYANMTSSTKPKVHHILHRNECNATKVLAYNLTQADFVSCVKIYASTVCCVYCVACIMLETGLKF